MIKIKNFILIRGADEEQFIIPDGVVAISSLAFCNCEKLKSIVIPDSVITIKFNAFYRCNSLKTVYCNNKVFSSAIKNVEFLPISALKNE